MHSLAIREKKKGAPLRHAVRGPLPKALAGGGGGTPRPECQKGAANPNPRPTAIPPLTPCKHSASPT